MLKKPAEKLIKAERLGRKISPVFVVNNDRLKPYAEMFLFDQKNIEQKSLGTLLGFFKINDTSIESAYIVNFLTSVLKKEYFSRAQRTAPHALEAALNKTNLALSELAKQGNVTWIGKIEAAICALENNAIHFSVSGVGKIFLFRNGILTDISDGLAPEDNPPHPLKTFTDISSGRVRKDDRIMLLTQELLNILDTTDIQRESAHFDHESFSRFIHTALVNEFDLAAATIIDFFGETVRRTEKSKNTSRSENKKQLENVFSQNSFHHAKTDNEPRQSENDTADQSQESSRNEQIHPTAGHIYIQQQNMVETRASSYFSKHYPIWKETALEKWDQMQLSIQFSLRRSKRYAEKTWQSFSDHMIESIAQWKQSHNKREDPIRQEQKQLETTQNIIRKNKKNKTLFHESEIRSEKQGDLDTYSKIRENRVTVLHDEQIQSTWIQPKTPHKIAFSTQKTFPIIYNALKKVGRLLRTAIPPELIDTCRLFFTQKSKILFSFILPSIQKIRVLFSRMNSHQKILSLCILGCIILLPFFLLQSYSSEDIQKKSSIEEVIQPKQPAINPIESETNAVLYDTDDFTKITFFTEPVQKIFSIGNSSIAAIGDKHIFIITDSQQNAYSIANMPDISFVESAYMPDLRMLFLYTSEKKLYAFNINSKKFEENTIAFDEKAETPLLAAYLTYLYVLYPEEKIVYRYPRAEGGFAEKTKWTRKTLDVLATTRSWSIDGSIYVANESGIIKLFRGEQATFTLEPPKVNAKFDTVYTENETSPLAVLDKINSRIIVYSKDGSILQQHLFPSSFKIRTYIVNEHQVVLLLESGELIHLSTE